MCRSDVPVDTEISFGQNSHQALLVLQYISEGLGPQALLRVGEILRRFSNAAELHLNRTFYRLHRFWEPFGTEVGSPLQVSKVSLM